MKTKRITIFKMAALVPLFAILFFAFPVFHYSSAGGGIVQTEGFTSENSENQENETIDKEQEFYKRIYYPDGDPTPDMKYKLSQQIAQMPSEDLPVNSWVLMGPSGAPVYSNQSNTFSGRATNIEVNGVPSIRVATASGGLWAGDFIFPVPLSDNLGASLRIGSFCSNPSNTNNILVGTGENFFYGVSGAGLFMTTNTGASYTQIAISPTPYAFYELRYAPGSSSVIHAATSSGYFRSTNAGYNWTLYLSSLRVTDVVVDPLNTNNVYAAVWDSLNGGVYKSTTAGTTWSRITTGGIPLTNIGRTSIGISASNPAIMYVNMSRYGDNMTLGVYKTTNSGSTWTNVTPNPSFHGKQGFHNCIVGVHPTNPNIVFVGGVDLWRSVNGGTLWTLINGAHTDYHDIVWTTDLTTIYVCNDGGVSLTYDNGTTWQNTFNHFPITQVVGFDVSPNGNYYFGGTQDNSIVGTTNRGVNWFVYGGGDGGYTSIFPNVNSTIAMTSNNGPIGFPPMLSTNSGQTWTSISNGIVVTDQGFTEVRNDNRASPYLYHNNGPFVYRSTNTGASWTKLNTTAFNCKFVSDIYVPTYNAASGPIVYASLYDDVVTSFKAERYVNGTWTDISAGLPASRYLTKIVSWDINNNIIYALMSGSTGGQKIFQSFNRGGAWVDITGDLPNVVVTDIILHPSNGIILYLGTTTGCYKTINGGNNWVRWNNGMPNATEIREFASIDSISQNGKYFICAASYGRSVWKRDISGDDPVGVSQNTNSIPNKFALKQNFPNPFNPSTKIKFDIPGIGKNASVNVIIKVYDIEGQEVASLVNSNLKPGSYETTFDGSNYSSGIYFYKLVAGDFVETKKMMLVK